MQRPNDARACVNDSALLELDGRGRRLWFTSARPTRKSSMEALLLSDTESAKDGADSSLPQVRREGPSGIGHWKRQHPGEPVGRRDWRPLGGPDDLIDFVSGLHLLVHGEIMCIGCRSQIQSSTSTL